LKEYSVYGRTALIFPYEEFTKCQPANIVENRSLPCKGNALIARIADIKKPAKEFSDWETLYKRMRRFLKITLDKIFMGVISIFRITVINYWLSQNIRSQFR